MHYGEWSWMLCHILRRFIEMCVFRNNIPCLKIYSMCLGTKVFETKSKETISSNTFWKFLGVFKTLENNIILWHWNANVQKLDHVLKTQMSLGHVSRHDVYTTCLLVCLKTCHGVFKTCQDVSRHWWSFTIICTKFWNMS